MMVTMNNPTIADPASVARALANNAEHVFIAMLGEPSSVSRREYRWGNHGSLAGCLARPKRGLWNDFESGEGGDLLHLVARQRGVSLGKAIDIAKQEFLGDFVPMPIRRGSPPRVANVEHGNAHSGIAQRLWREAGPIAGTLGEAYFVEKRKLEIGGLSVDHVLRWHGDARAVLALMTNPLSGEPVGVHRTFLDADGAKIDRKMLGRQGVIRLSRDDAVTMSLGITEGIEDGFAVLLSGWSPVWAASSAGALAKFPVPGGIKSLTIFADADTAGLQSAASCHDRWRMAGREAVIAVPGRLA